MRKRTTNNRQSLIFSLSLRSDIHASNFPRLPSQAFNAGPFASSTWARILERCSFKGFSGASSEVTATVDYLPPTSSTSYLPTLMDSSEPDSLELKLSFTKSWTAVSIDARMSSSILVASTLLVP